MTDVISELYEELLGNRSYRGELRITGFTDEDYEELYYTILELLAPYFDGNYEDWYMQQVTYRNRFVRNQSKHYDIYDPLMKPFHMHTIQNQLTVLKYFVYRQYHSGYPAKRKC